MKERKKKKQNMHWLAGNIKKGGKIKEEKVKDSQLQYNEKTKK